MTFSPSFALPLLPAHGAHGPGTVVLCHAVCSPGYFNNKQMKNPLRTVFLPTGGASWRVHPTGHCLLAQVPCTKKTCPSEFPDPVGMGLFNNGTSQQHSRPLRGPEQAETFMKSVSLSQSFPVRAGDCWVTFAGFCGCHSIWK